MKAILATMEELQQVVDIVTTTISKVFPKYYFQEAVDFFLNHNRQTSIARDISRNQVWLFANEDNIFVGTGTITENMLSRIYVLPQYHKHDCHSAIMDFLEEKVSENYDQVMLDALPTSMNLCLKRGYSCVENHWLHVDQGKLFFYETLKKDLIRPFEKTHSYNGRIFVTVINSDNGEVDGSTIFKYYQKDDVVWADYQGGKIVKGYLLGKVLEDGRMDIVYHHINNCGALRRGKCLSTPEMNANGQLQLHEAWQWLDDENYCGQSMVMEAE